MSRTPWIDGHLDLAYLAQQGLDLAHPSPEPERFGVTLPALRAGGVRLVLGTLFTERGSRDAWGYKQDDDGSGAAAAALRQLDIYRGMEDAGAIRIVRTRADLEGWDREGPLRVVILMEGGDPIRSPEDVRRWFELGVRVVGLTWALGSRWAGGNAADGPLTAGGHEVVRALDEAGVLHDASHLSRAAFDGLMAATRRTVVASHSNCAAITGDTPRHLTDEQVRAIAGRGGLCGLNLFGKFLAQGRPATLEDAVAHVLRVRDLGTSATLALGSDFDGGFTPLDCPEGSRRPEELPGLDAALAAAGLDEVDRANFRCGNWIRVLKASLPG
ncbi:MAG: peptidase M19 [Planctomycetes bacterium]|nr:peptidase M19 [Planctomycetota bacterium]